MAKCLVGAAGGAVTVEGLAADALVPGATVTVKNGSKLVRQATSDIELLAAFVFDKNTSLRVCLWNGQEYETMAQAAAGQTYSFAGIPKFFTRTYNASTFSSVCGVEIPTGGSRDPVTVHDGLANNEVVVSWNLYRYSEGSVYVYGIKGA